MPLDPLSFNTTCDIFEGRVGVPFATLRQAAVPCTALSAFASGAREGPTSNTPYTHVICFPKGTDVRDWGGIVLGQQATLLGDFLRFAPDQLPNYQVQFAEIRDKGLATEYVRCYCQRGLAFHPGPPPV